jgi:hypothetical protein
MKYDLVKFHHWLLLSTFKSKWFEENIKLQIISLLSWMIYPEYREQNSFLSVVKKNKFILIVLSIFFVWTTSFFTFGRLTSGKETIVVEKKTYINNYLKGLDFEEFQSKRKATEYAIFTKCKIQNYKNLHKLPDEVFFTMLMEIERNDIPYSIFVRMMDKESSFLFIKNKNSGAKGYCQVMPDTQRMILRKIGSTQHPQIDNIRIAAYHLKVQYLHHKSKGLSEKESWLNSLIDYNGGDTSLAQDIMKVYHKDII